jgi:DASS family divalent anion:Na+ symporter
MITLANKLKSTGFIDWVAQHMQHWVMGMDPLLALCMLWVVYLYSMFFFASDTAHAGALLGAFYFTLKLSHVPALLAIPALAYASSICSGLTNYSTGTTVIYYGHGYVKPPLWFKVGLVVSCSHIVIWLGGGLLWWRVLGWY